MQYSRVVVVRAELLHRLPPQRKEASLLLLDLCLHLLVRLLALLLDRPDGEEIQPHIPSNSQCLGCDIGLVNQPEQFFWPARCRRRLMLCEPSGSRVSLKAPKNTSRSAAGLIRRCFRVYPKRLLYPCAIAPTLAALSSSPTRRTGRLSTSLLGDPMPRDTEPKRRIGDRGRVRLGCVTGGLPVLMFPVRGPPRVRKSPSVETVSSASFARSESVFWRTARSRMSSRRALIRIPSRVVC